MTTEILLSFLLKFSELNRFYFGMFVFSGVVFALSTFAEEFKNEMASKWALKLIFAFAILSILSYYAPTPADLIEVKRQMKSYRVEK